MNTNDITLSQAHNLMEMGDRMEEQEWLDNLPIIPDAIPDAATTDATPDPAATPDAAATPDEKIILDMISDAQSKLQCVSESVQASFEAYEALRKKHTDLVTHADKLAKDQACMVDMSPEIWGSEDLKEAARKRNQRKEQHLRAQIVIIEGALNPDKKQMHQDAKTLLRMGRAESSGFVLYSTAGEPPALAPAAPRRKVKKNQRSSGHINYGTADLGETNVTNIDDAIDKVMLTPGNIVSAFSSAVKTIYPPHRLAGAVSKANESTWIVLPGGRSFYTPSIDKNIPTIPVRFDTVSDIAIENIARRTVLGLPEKDLAEEIAAMPPMEYTILSEDQKNSLVEAVKLARAEAMRIGNGCPLVDYGQRSEARYGLHCGLVIMDTLGDVVGTIPHYTTLMQPKSQGPNLFDTKVASSIQKMVDSGRLSRAGYALFFDENTQRMATRVGQNAPAPCIVAVPQECFVGENVLEFVPGAFRPKVFLQLESAGSKRLPSPALRMLFGDQIAEYIDVPIEKKEQQSLARRENSKKRKYTPSAMNAATASMMAAAAAAAGPPPANYGYGYGMMPMQMQSMPMQPTQPMMQPTQPMMQPMDDGYPVPGSVVRNTVIRLTPHQLD